MTEPQPSPQKLLVMEPTTARALWPTFMRRTLPARDIAQLEANPDRPYAGQTRSDRLG